MKLFVINLDRQPERLEHMRAVFADLGLEFCRVRAFDGKELSEDQVRIWRTDAYRGDFRPGETACFLSHRECWKQIIDQSLACAAIFEDDLHMAGGAGALLQDDSWVPQEVDIIKLETMRIPVRTDKAPAGVAADRALYRLRSKHMGAAGYIVTRRGAEKLVHMSERFSAPVDHFMFNPEFPWASSFATLQLSPALCIQDYFLKEPARTVGLGSDLHEERAVRKPRGRAKLWREIKRPFLKLFHFAERNAGNLLTDKRWTKIPFE